MEPIKNALGKGRSVQPQVGIAASQENNPPAQKKPTPKKHRARLFMLRSGSQGFTENEILRYCRLSSGRNYPTELERHLNIILERIQEPNTDGIGGHFRYRITCRRDAMRIITLVNHRAFMRGHEALSKKEITEILNLYPNAVAIE